MKINFSNTIKNITRNRITIFILFFFLILITLVIIKKDTKVKGETSKEYYAVVWDDQSHQLLRSSSADVNETLKQNNIEIYPEDILRTDLILDPIADGGVGLKIVIKRAPVYYAEVDGIVKKIRTWDKSVEKIIGKGTIPLGPKDQVSPALNSEITQGATIVITRVNEADVDVFEDIEYSATEKSSNTVPFGQKQVIQAGKKGQRKKTYRVVYHNGVEISRWLLSSVIVTSSKDKITAYGVVTGRANFGYYSGMVTSFYKGMTGRYLLVTNLANGKQVKVKIIGSGPFNGPILDMGTEPFQAIGGKISDGFIPLVSVQLLD